MSASVVGCPWPGRCCIQFVMPTEALTQPAAVTVTCIAPLRRRRGHRQPAATCVGKENFTAATLLAGTADDSNSQSRSNKQWFHRYPGDKKRCRWYDDICGLT